MESRVLGIDPGLQATGYGLIAIRAGHARLLEGGVVRTHTKDSLPSRLASLHTDIATVVERCAASVVVVEDLFTSYTHPQTAVLMGHARGVILLTAGEAAIPLVVYTASMVKRALTGNGRASKGQVAQMVCNLLTVADTGVPDHVTDALALALCHANTLGRPSSLGPAGGAR